MKDKQIQKKLYKLHVNRMKFVIITTMNQKNPSSVNMLKIVLVYFRKKLCFAVSNKMCSKIKYAFPRSVTHTLFISYFEQL